MTANLSQLSRDPVRATDFVGSKTLDESLARDHVVTAVGRNLDALPVHERPTPMQGDATKPGELAPLVAGHDAVIRAVAGVHGEPWPPIV